MSVNTSRSKQTQVLDQILLTPGVLQHHGTVKSETKIYNQINLLNSEQSSQMSTQLKNNIDRSQIINNRQYNSTQSIPDSFFKINLISIHKKKSNSINKQKQIEEKLNSCSIQQIEKQEMEMQSIYQQQLKMQKSQKQKQMEIEKDQQKTKDIKQNENTQLKQNNINKKKIIQKDNDKKLKLSNQFKIIKLNSSGQQIKQPEISIKYPEISIKYPEISIKQPEISIKYPDISIKLLQNPLNNQSQQNLQNQFDKYQKEILFQIKNINTASNSTPSSNQNQSQVLQQSQIPQVSTLFQGNLEQLKLLNKDLEQQMSTLQISQSLMAQLSDAIQIIKSIKFDEINISHSQIKIQVKQLIKNINTIIIQCVQYKGSVEILLKSDLIVEIFDLIKQSQFDYLTEKLLKTIREICLHGSTMQTFKPFEIGIIQPLIPIFKNKNNNIQKCILQIFSNILINNNQISKQSTQSQSLQISSSSQSHLDYLLHHYSPNPYLPTLEQQGFVEIIIDEMMLNNNTCIDILKRALKLFDSLYLNGFILKEKQQIQLYNYLCKKLNPSNDNINQQRCVLECLISLSINKENHNQLINIIQLENILDYITALLLNNNNQQQQLLLLYINFIFTLFIFGSTQTQELISNQYSKENLKDMVKVKNINLLINSYQDPNVLKELVLIQRTMKRMNQIEIIELIQNGLMIKLNQMVENSVKQDYIEAVMIVVWEIIKLLVKNDIQLQQIIKKTDLILQYIILLNSIPLIYIQYLQLKLLKKLIGLLSNKQKMQLFPNGMIQIVVRTLNSQIQSIKDKSRILLFEMIQFGLKNLKIQEQHPFLKHLAIDGTLNLLIQQFKGQRFCSSQINHAVNLARLFKSSPLEPETQEKIINYLKWSLQDGIDGLIILAENPANHGAILSKDFIRTIINNDNNIYKYLCIINIFLKFGSYQNRKMVVFEVKERVQSIKIEKNLNIIIQKYQSNQQKQEKIKKKVTQLLTQVRNVEEKIEEEGEYEELNCMTFQNKKQNFQNEDDDSDSDTIKDSDDTSSSTSSTSTGTSYSSDEE